MSTKLACSVVPTVETCPNCKGEMTVREVTPILLAVGFEDVTYRCKSCRSEMKRTFKRCSGAWELVTLPSFFTLRAEAKTATEANRNQGLALGGMLGNITTIRAMEIEGTTFGTIMIDGKTYEHDVIIKKRRKYAHALD